MLYVVCTNLKYHPTDFEVTPFHSFSLRFPFPLEKLCKNIYFEILEISQYLKKIYNQFPIQ